MEDALRAVTIDECGTLTPGKRADLVLLESDPHAVLPETLAAIKVCGTWLDGREVWAA